MSAAGDQQRNPRVSVIIPVYNRERFIGRTVQSVLDQTFQDFELLAVDDGSTDGSRAVLESFGDRVVVLEHEGQVNKGQSAAINLGLRRARGDIIAVLDSDDLWKPRKLEVLAAYLDRHPDVGLVYSNGTYIDEQDQWLGRFYGPSHRERSDPSDVLVNCYFLLPNNSIVRRSVYEAAGGFDESLRTAQDHDMAIRVAEVAKLAYVDEDLFAYRRHGNSISQTVGDLRWRNGFRILAKAVERYPYPRRIVNKRKAVLHFRLAQLAWKRRRPLAAIGRALVAGALDPVRGLAILLGRERISSPHS